MQILNFVPFATRMRYGYLGVAFGLAVFSAGAVPTPATLTLEESVYLRGDSKAAATVIDTAHYTATLVPEMGGRILRWVDKQTGTDLVYDNGYGGLLDDHDARIRLPYQVEWIVRGPDKAVVRLTREDTVIYRKTVTFHAGRPVIEVEYDIENHGQNQQRLLFRNVVRPAGKAFSGEELYCYSRVPGIQHAKGMPRTDDQAAPWCALVHPPTRMVVANAFEGDILARLYTWRGSLVAPTYEFMFPPLEAGHRIRAHYTWSLAHGFETIDYAHRAFVAQLDGAWDGTKLSAELKLAATWDPMPDLKVTAELLRADRTPLADARVLSLPVATLDTVNPLNISTPATDTGNYVILQLTLADSAIGSDPIIFEKPFARDGNDKLLADYRQPIRWVGADVPQELIPGWEQEVAYRIQPDDADRVRGYLVFDEFGERAGKHTTDLAIQMAQNEPEAFPLRISSLDKAGEVRIDVSVPAGMTLECFVPETVPQTNWGRTLNGYKLIPGTTCHIKPGDDRLLYFRLHTREATPGVHRGRIVLAVEDAEPTEVELNIRVHPIRFPSRDLYLVFDVNNLVNQLCARKIKGTDYAWDETLAQNYLADMAAHGVRGQTMVGVTAPNSHYWYNRVKIRESGQPLLDAIAAEPDRFRERSDLPALDFSEWDWLMDRLLEHGMTHVRFPMGGCGESFQQGHNRITQRIYGKTLPTGDVRQMIVQEWYTRELSRYFKDRGLARVLVTIDDEIPGEKLAWWVQHAYRSIQMGVDPGVTQSAATIRDDQKMNMVAPFMKYWIIGTLHKGSIDQRRIEGIIKSEHWVTTYHSSANHWQPYANTRAVCGLNSAFFDLDACWIQCYYRWRQSEAIIYPDEDGPISSAAWEGARDGLDDGNLLLLARVLTAGLPDAAQRTTFEARIEKIVGMREDSLIHFVDRLTGVGTVTAMDRQDTTLMRLAKEALLTLVDELAVVAPVQRAAVNHGLRPIIRDGRACFQIPDNLPMASKADAFLKQAAGRLAYEADSLLAGIPEPTQPLLFVGTLEQLTTRLPVLAETPELADLCEVYPRPGEYVLRYVRHPAPATKKGVEPVEPAECMLIVAGDAAGADKALANLLNVLTAPRTPVQPLVAGPLGAVSTRLGDDQ